MRLRTNQGTYVVARDGGELLHLPDSMAQEFQSVWDLAYLPVPIPGLVEAAVTEGPLAPSILMMLSDGRVAFRREHMYLCADPTRSELRFDRADVGEWERFAFETAESDTVRLGWDGPPVQFPSLSRPVLIDTVSAYQIMTADAASIVLVSCEEFSKDPINRYTMRDGSWIVDVDSTPDPDQPFLVYWFYPFSAHIHVWRLDQAGRRLLGYDLSESEARSFLLSRRSLGPAITARLYMLAQSAAQHEALAVLREDLCGAAQAGSAEALYAVLCDSLAFSPNVVRSLADRASSLIRAANRAVADENEGHLARFTVGPFSEALNSIGPLSDALMRLDPALRCLNLDELQGELDFSAYFANAKHLPPARCALPFTLHRQTEESLAKLLGGHASNQTVGIVLRPNRTMVEFHYVNSHMLPRTILSIRYAYYVFCINQAYVWKRLDAIDKTASAWMIRLEAGDLPTVPEPSVAFERWSGNTNYALVPDPYYFDTKAFRRGWFTGDIPDWSEKSTRFLWRGSTTGAGDLTRDTIWQTPRVRLCEIGRALGPVADFGITAVVQARSEADANDIKLRLQDRGLWREGMYQHVMGSAKFLVEIDGNANSWGFLAKLLMGCCVLKVDSPFEQWFYHRLRPWVHYVPIAHDLSDLPKKVQWCLRNQKACRKIAAAGQSLAESLTFDKEMAAAADVFLAMALRAA